MKRIGIITAALVALCLTSCEGPGLTNAYVRQFEGKTVRTIMYDSSTNSPDQLTIYFTDGSVLVVKASAYMHTVNVNK